MSEITFAGALSHTAQMIRKRDLLPSEQEKTLYGSVDKLAKAIRDSGAETLVVFYGDHYNFFNVKNMPAICIGVSKEFSTCGDGGVSKFNVKGDFATSAFLAEGLLADGFDIAYSMAMELDHGFACPMQLLQVLDIPVVPIRINLIAPPLISTARSHQLGHAIGKLLRADGASKRIGVLGTGGISHFLPFPDPMHPKDAEDLEMLDLMNDGSDPQRLSQLIMKKVDEFSTGNMAHTAINEDFDRQFLAQLATKDISPLLKLSSASIVEQAGAGGQEIRTWLAASAVVEDPGCEIFCYEAVPQWLTGIAVAQFNLSN